MPDTELQTGTVDRAQPAGGMTPATAANSTTLAKLEADRRRAKVIIGIITTIATTAMLVPVGQPWNFIASAVLFTGAVVVAYFTNSMTPEELEALTDKAGAAMAAAAKKKDGAP